MYYARRRCLCDEFYMRVFCVHVAGWLIHERILVPPTHGCPLALMGRTSEVRMVGRAGQGGGRPKHYRHGSYRGGRTGSVKRKGKARLDDVAVTRRLVQVSTGGVLGGRSYSGHGGRDVRHRPARGSKSGGRAKQPKTGACPAEDAALSGRKRTRTEARADKGKPRSSAAKKSQGDPAAGRRRMSNLTTLAAISVPFDVHGSPSREVGGTAAHGGRRPPSPPPRRSKRSARTGAPAGANPASLFGKQKRRRIAADSEEAGAGDARDSEQVCAIGSGVGQWPCTLFEDNLGDEAVQFSHDRVVELSTIAGMCCAGIVERKSAKNGVGLFAGAQGIPAGKVVCILSWGRVYAHNPGHSVCVTGGFQRYKRSGCGAPAHNTGRGDIPATAYSGGSVNEADVVGERNALIVQVRCAGRRHAADRGYAVATVIVSIRNIDAGVEILVDYGQANASCRWVHRRGRDRT